MLSQYAEELLADRFLTPDDEVWIRDQIDTLTWMFEHPQWPQHIADELHTQKQVGYLAGAMDLERGDRILVVELIMGYSLFYVLGEWFPGVAEPENPDLYPGPSTKDVRITRWEMSVLIDYFLDGDGAEFNERLGFGYSKRDNDKARTAARRTARAAAATDNGQPELSSSI